MDISETQQESVFQSSFGRGEEEEIVLNSIEVSEIGNNSNGALKEKKRNRPRRNGKAANVTVVDEGLLGGVELTREDRRRFFYSRVELEDIRFERVEEQRKKWIEVYCGLGPDVQKEFDSLFPAHFTHKQFLVDFDPRRRFRKPPRSVLSGDNSNSEFLESHRESTNVLDPVSNENDDLIVEGEDCDDSDEGLVSIQRPAFFVRGEPDFDSGPPEDGLEYLRRVRWEAERLPNVKVAKVERSKLNKEQSVYMPQVPAIATCPQHLLPLKEWEDEFLASFSDLRLALSRLDDSGVDISSQHPLVSVVHEEQSSNQLTEGSIIEDFDNLASGDDHSQSDAGEDNNAHENSYPTLSVILRMAPVTRVSLLRKRINEFESASTLSRDDCLWLFALCAAVDCPLHADTSASLRSLLRKCASLRAAKTSVDDEVIMLNILATISGRYFGQAGN